MSFLATMGKMSEIKQRLGLGENGAIQELVDRQTVQRMDSFLPYDTGRLLQSRIAAPGEIIFTAPYARYLYYGRLMVGPSTGSAWAEKGETKVLTNQRLQYRGAPQRGAYWFERMKVQYGEDILRGVQKEFGK